MISLLTVENNERLLIMGDFNYKNIIWDEQDPRGDKS